MSRELPYFKFFTSEWLNGDVTLEDYELQGLFVNICAYYWHKDGKVNLDQLIKKFKSNRINELIDLFMYVDKDNNVYIKFLDEQLTEFSIRKRKLSEAGKKGAKIKAKLKEQEQLPFNHPLTINQVSLSTICFNISF